MNHLMIHVIAFSLAAVAVFADDQDSLVIRPDGSEHIKNKGENFALTCSLPARQKSSTANFHWLDPRNQTMDKNYLNVNTRFQIRSPREGQLQLVLQNLQESDVGVYTCVAEYDNKIISKSVRVKTILPITFIDAPEHQLARRSDRNFKLKCNVQARPSPIVSWSRGNARLTNNDNKYIIENDGLTITDVQESDDGPYTCEVLVEETGDFKSRVINLEVISEPIFINTPDAVNLTEGERGTIPCNATGKPFPKFSWIKKNTKKNLTNSIMYAGTLNLDRVTKEDDDIFICVAENSARTVQREIKVNVQSKPQVIEVINSTIAVEKGGQLTCFVYGNPRPNVTIRKQEYKYQDTNDVRSIQQSTRPDSKGRPNVVEAVLKFDHVVKADEGLYDCIATNKIGETISKLHLVAEYKPVISKLPPPLNKVTTWDTLKANLTCNAQAIPNATISWYQGQNPTPLDRMSYGSMYQFFTHTGTSILQITPSQKSVYGPYKCRAVNPHGSDEYDVILEEGFVPEPPKLVRINTTTATSVTFEFVGPSFTGNMPIKGYRVQFKHQAPEWTGAEVRPWPIGGPYILNDLKPQTRYMFRFQTMNQVGDSTWGAFTDVETPAISEPSEPVISSVVPDGSRFIKSQYAHKIELRWAIPSSNGADIDKYVVKVCQSPEEALLGVYVSDNAEKCRDPVDIPYNTVLSSYTIENLDANTLYRVELAAHNNLGLSKSSQRFFKTNATSESQGEKMPNGLSSAVIIYIVIALLVGFLVIVDIFCFFVGKTGVIYTLCGGCCFKKKKNDDKLGSESRDLITNGLKNKVDIEEQSPMITDGTKRDIAVEYDVKKGVSKTGFVGKDSAV